MSLKRTRQTPRAIAVAFDYKRLQVNAVQFVGPLPEVEPDLLPEPGDAGAP